MPELSAETLERAGRVRLILLDVDGVLTDGAIIVDDHGVESKHFHVRDGFAMRHAERVAVHSPAMRSVSRSPVGDGKARTRWTGTGKIKSGRIE